MVYVCIESASSSGKYPIKYEGTPRVVRKNVESLHLSTLTASLVIDENNTDEFKHATDLIIYLYNLEKLESNTTTTTFDGMATKTPQNSPSIAPTSPNSPTGYKTPFSFTL